MPETTRLGLQERQDATRKGLEAKKPLPLILTASAESFNATNDQNSSSPAVRSKSYSHCGSGYNSILKNRARVSGHSVFVLNVDGEPLTPCKPSKARKLLKGKQAKPVWNKFGMFGIQMLRRVGNKHPETKHGYDIGTKFEGHAIVCGREGNLCVMWKLPDKKDIVKKKEEQKRLRRARRWRNCRRRQCKSDNREKDGFIAPSQMVILQSRLKALKELFRCYPVDVSTVEDVRFNHRDKRHGKNFSTMEVAKNTLYSWIREHATLVLVEGHKTQEKRKMLGYKKTRSKDGEKLTSHCTDALTLATDVAVIPERFFVVDDSYRPVRRRLHDTQPSKGGVRYPYSSGNFKGIRKGTLCKFGQICGGTKNTVWIRDSCNKRIGRALSKIGWLSHGFKTSIPPPIKIGGLLEVRL